MWISRSNKACLAIIWLLAGLSIRLLASERLILNINPDWRFIKADPPGASSPDYDHSHWEVVSLPHTYNDTDTFDDWSLPGHRGEQNQWSGRTWYRKILDVPQDWAGRKVYIEFQAVRQVAEVYINGHLLGVCKTGFTPFGFDLTPYLRFGHKNILAVMCDNRFVKDPLPGRSGDTNLAELSARVNQAIPDDLADLQADQIPWNNPHWHPAHGGIYRDVRLYLTDPLHICLPLFSFLGTTGPYIYQTRISEDSARIVLEVPIQNDLQKDQVFTVTVDIQDHAQVQVLSMARQASCQAGARTTVVLSGLLEKPRFWSPDNPYLYKACISIQQDGRLIDRSDVPFGIRMVQWTADKGLVLNGKPIRLRGWGQKPTNEWPGLGAALPAWLHFYTLELMKAAGANIVRWGHCAAGPAQIEACDRLGLCVIQPGVDGESDTIKAAWRLRASAFRDVVIYFRNNPSILIWEGGNQKVSLEHAMELRGYMDLYDGHGQRAYAHRRADRITAQFMDVGIGTEGGREISWLPVVEGEYNREESPRRIWDDHSPPSFGYPEAKGQTYQLTSEQFAVNQVGQYVRKLLVAGHCGGANWIFSDSTSGGRVSCEVARASGEVDAVRLPKEAYYVCKAMFTDEPYVHIIGHWTYPEGTRKAIYVVANTDQVELVVNGHSYGKKGPQDRYLFVFDDVLWQAGQITGIGYISGRQVASQTKSTAGDPVGLRMKAITAPGGLRADGSDVVLIDVEAVDANGQRCPTFQKRVDFEILGPGVWRGGYNSGKVNSINNMYLDLECGINRVAVRSTLIPGTITIKATCSGLTPASVQVQSTACILHGGWTSQMPQSGPILPVQERKVSGGTISRAGMGQVATSPLSYSGPSPLVHIEKDAQNGRNIYVDRDWPFKSLPTELEGCDWVQAADDDALYVAEDLMEIALKAGSRIYIAHDDRLPRPVWLLGRFRPTDIRLDVAGQSMTVFATDVDEDQSLTLGPNTDDPSIRQARMYIVFIRQSIGSGQHRADWLRAAKWGIMIHYLAERITTQAGLNMDVDTWNRLINDFDVEGLGKQLSELKAGYLIITIGQNSGYYLAPNPTYDRFVQISPSRCSKRDLVTDLADRLSRDGIRLIVYLPSGAPASDKEAVKALEWRSGPFANLGFQVKWEQVIRDWSVRWGRKVSGWWFDGCYWPNAMYRRPNPPNFASLAAAARAGNPDSILAFNCGVVGRLISVCPEEDYTAGETEDPNRLLIRRLVEGRVDGAVPHVLTYLGQRWGTGPARFSRDQAVAISQRIIRAGAAITWDVPVGPDGLISDEFFEILLAISRSVAKDG